MASETKSLPVDNNVYLMVKKKQSELTEIAGRYIQLKDIVSLILEAGINNIHVESENIAKEYPEYTKHMADKGWILRLKYKGGQI